MLGILLHQGSCTEQAILISMPYLLLYVNAHIFRVLKPVQVPHACRALNVLSFTCCQHVVTAGPAPRPFEDTPLCKDVLNKLQSRAVHVVDGGEDKCWYCDGGAGDYVVPLCNLLVPNGSLL